MLYPAMEDFVLILLLAKVHRLKPYNLNFPLYLIGATTSIGLNIGFRSRFGATYKLEFYENSDIEKY